ncbi:MAG: HAMP domain-containing protein, partial [Candidatus Omnitrophica bacterium]|nr:HAMP domain-containing protein [Candidatus Omnitrophota bacterium]
NLSAGILKNNIEATIRQVQPQEIPTYVQSSLKELKDSHLVKEVVVFDQDGKIIGSTDENLKDQNTGYKDIYRLQTLKESSKTGKWLLPEVDNTKHSINVYIAVKLDPKDELTYVAKSSFPFATAQEAMFMVYKPVVIAIIIIIIANIIFGYLLSKNIIGPIKMLNNVTKIIANGDLTVRTQIKTNDELEELGSTFNYMTEQLIKMKERA